MRIGLKFAFVLFLAILILIPLSLVRGVIAERQAYRAQAVADVVRSHAGAQAVAGPVLTVPYTQTVEVEEPNGTGGTTTVRRRQQGAWTFFPTMLDVHGRIEPGTRRRGIHEVHVYTWKGRMSGAFRAVIPDDAPPGTVRVVGEPWLSLAIADVRGIRGTPRLRVDGRDVELREGHGARGVGGLHARLPAPRAGDVLSIASRVDIELAGAESLAVVPLGKRNRVELASSWPHPGFEGISPVRSTIGALGFRAHWQLASVATDAQRQYLAGAGVAALTPSARDGRDTGAAPTLDALGVVLVDPVDAYSQADRATKYGLLFVLLTFVGFFMLEVTRAVPVHPIQYGLVGLALALFFLLLVSLSEHIRFGAAYLVAGGACIGLIGFYLRAVLGGARRAGGFSAMLALLYAALYGVLVSEDNALVLGSGLLFVALAAVMVLTRNLDWYRAGARFGAHRP